MKYIFILMLITACGEKVIENKDAPVVDAIALVLYQDTIYHCSKVVYQNWCRGLYAECGTITLRCAGNTKVEYLQ